MKDKLSLLFICLGNICRSPAAEAIMKERLQQLGDKAEGITVDSAGLGPWHEGQLPDSRMRRHGAARGYDISSIARQITPADFDRYDYIIGMDHNNMKALRRLAPSSFDKSRLLCAADFMTRHPDHDTVPDPYYGGDSDFELALDLIEDAVDGIIKRFI